MVIVPLVIGGKCQVSIFPVGSMLSGSFGVAWLAYSRHGGSVSVTFISRSSGPLYVKVILNLTSSHTVIVVASSLHCPVVLLCHLSIYNDLLRTYPIEEDT